MAVRLDDEGLCRAHMDGDQVGGDHRLLITLGRTRMDSPGRRWSLDFPNTQLSWPVMDASVST